AVGIDRHAVRPVVAAAAEVRRINQLTAVAGDLSQECIVAIAERCSSRTLRRTDNREIERVRGAANVGVAGGVYGDRGGVILLRSGEESGPEDRTRRTELRREGVLDCQWARPTNVNGGRGIQGVERQDPCPLCIASGVIPRPVGGGPSSSTVGAAQEETGIVG